MPLRRPFGFPSCTWANRPSASAVSTDDIYLITDIAPGGTLMRSNGTMWLPVTGDIPYGQSFDDVQTATGAGDTGVITLLTKTIKGGLLGINGGGLLTCNFQHTNSANAKTVRVALGGTNIAVISEVSAGSSGFVVEFGNRGNASEQYGGFVTTRSGTASTLYATAAINTANDWDLTVSVQKATGTETFIMDAWTLQLMPAS